MLMRRDIADQVDRTVEDSGETGVSETAFRPPISSEFVRHHQRNRAVAAAAQIAHEVGLGQLTVSDVCRRAQMARATFYALFANREGLLAYCFAANYEKIAAPLADLGRRDEGPFFDRFARALGAHFDAVAAEPRAAEFCLVHGFGAPEQAEGCDFEAMVALLRRLLQEGREDLRQDGHLCRPEPAAGTEDYLARAIASLAGNLVLSGRAGALPGYAREMCALVGGAFFGPDLLPAGADDSSPMSSTDRRGTDTGREGR
jgi:AcrR family transcriptional regulator